MSALNSFLNLAERRREEQDHASFFQLLIDDCDPFDHFTALVEFSERVPFDIDMDEARKFLGVEADEWLDENCWYAEQIVESAMLENPLFKVTEEDEGHIERAAEMAIADEFARDFTVTSPFDQYETPVYD